MKTYKKKHIGERGRKSGRERERGGERLLQETKLLDGIFSRAW